MYCMYCMHCGQELPPEACFCPRCGRRVEGEISPDTPAGTPAEPPSPAPKPKIDCGFTLAIVAVVMGNVIGIVALIYAVLASSMLSGGDYEGARRAARTGKIWSWAAIILSAIGLCLGMLVLPRLVELIAPGLTEI